MRRIPRKTLIVMLAALVAAFALMRWRQADPPALLQLSDLAFDAYQRLEPREPVGQPIRIIDIDEQSIAELGQWPWPRTTLAAMVDRMAELGAAAIAMDIVFSEPDRTGPEGFRRLLRERDWPDREAVEQVLATIPDNDEVFAQAIGRAPVILGFFVTPQERTLPPVKAGFVKLGDDPVPVLSLASGAVASLPAMLDQAVGTGSISLGVQADDIVRRVPLFLTDGDTRVWPSLAVEALRVALGETTIQLRTSAASGDYSAGSIAMTSFRIGEVVAPVDQRGNMLVYYARNDPALYLSARDLVSKPAEELRPLLEGHLVFVGTSAEGLRDIRVTSLGESVPGVFVHAQIADQILSGQFLSRPDWAKGVEIAAMLLVSVLTVLILPFAGPLLSAMFGALLAVGIGGGSWYAFSAHGLLIDPLFPMASGIAIYLLTTVLLFAFAEREKRFVRGAFQRYLAPDLLHKLEQNPESLKLGGEIRDMTLMFMDVRGFTPISEKLDPQQLVTFLNRLLSPLTEAIQSHEGAIDKYIGDSIMAFWNAPLDVDDHPRKAALAALDMLRIVRELNASDAFGFHDPAMGLGDVGIGVGLNTGPGCVGNMGSSSRFDYSVVGDTVNVAARIESTTKPAGWPILLSEATAEACAGFAILRGGAMPLKGKSKPAMLYALIGDEALAMTAQWKETEALHKDFLAAVEARDAALAKRKSLACLAAAPVDLSDFHAALLAPLEMTSQENVAQ